MTHLKIGDTAPNFDLPTDNAGNAKLEDYKGQKLVLYFYPKDDTPGCTTESCEFRDTLDSFKSLNTAIIGISKCSVAKHDKFKTKHNLNFPLISDENGTMCEDYGTWVEKNMYGKKYMGIQRATFLIGEQGKIEAIWPKVKVKGHVEEVCNTIAALEKAA